MKAQVAQLIEQRRLINEKEEDGSHYVRHLFEKMSFSINLYLQFLDNGNDGTIIKMDEEPEEDSTSSSSRFVCPMCQSSYTTKG